MFQISNRLLSAVKAFEGLRLTTYRDPIGKLTIGYGTTGDFVKDGLTITEEAAEEYLLDHLRVLASQVDTLVAVTTEQSMQDALLSLVYNIGIGAFARSSLLNKLNAYDYQGAAQEFQRWNKAGGKILPGLAARREQERCWFEEGIETPPPFDVA